MYKSLLKKHSNLITKIIFISSASFVFIFVIIFGTILIKKGSENLTEQEVNKKINKFSHINSLEKLHKKLDSIKDNFNHNSFINSNQSMPKVLTKSSAENIQNKFENEFSNNESSFESKNNKKKIVLETKKNVLNKLGTHCFRNFAKEYIRTTDSKIINKLKNLSQNISFEDRLLAINKEVIKNKTNANNTQNYQFAINENHTNKSFVVYDSEILEFIKFSNITSVYVNGINSKIKMNEIIFTLNSIVNNQKKLRLTEINENFIIFTDEEGNQYSREV